MNEVRKVLPPEVNEAAGQFLNQFYTLARLVNLYDQNNEVFQQPLEEFQNLERKLLDLEGKVEFRFIENEAFLNSTRIRLTPDIKSMAFGLLQDLRENGIGGFSLLSALTASHILRFVQALTQYFRAQKKDCEELNDELKKYGIVEIHFYPYHDFSADERDGRERRNYKHEDLLKTYAQFLCHTELLVSLAPGSNPIAFIDALRKVQRAMQKLVDRLDEEASEILSLHLLPAGEQGAVAQAVHVALLSLCLGHYLGLSRVQLADLGMCGLFYNRPLWHAEPALIEKGWGPYLHVVGLALDSGFNPSIMRRLLTGFHWQRHADGRGGVPPVREACIPDLFTRIVALVAQYVQLITPPNPRTGGMGLTPHNALKFLVTEKHLGLDEALLKMFVNRLGIHPVGSLVRLNTGELALVLSPPEKPQQVHCPRVKIIREADGREIVGEWIDLANDSRTIARTVPAAGVGVNVGHYLFVS